MQKFPEILLNAMKLCNAFSKGSVKVSDFPQIQTHKETLECIIRHVLQRIRPDYDIAFRLEGDEIKFEVTNIAKNPAVISDIDWNKLPEIIMGYYAKKLDREAEEIYFLNNRESKTSMLISDKENPKSFLYDIIDAMLIDRLLDTNEAKTGRSEYISRTGEIRFIYDEIDSFASKGKGTKGVLIYGKSPAIIQELLGIQFPQISKSPTP